MDETKERLLNHAGEVFAEVGFQGATIRDICAKAGTNVAAVNYHFGDKLALYTEVLIHAVDKSENKAWRDLKEDDPEVMLRNFIFLMFRNFHRPDKPSWHLKLMVHEMTNPTPALAQLVKKVIRPNFEKVSEIVGKLINRPPDDERTRMCVFSIVGQIHFYIHGRPVVSKLWPEMQMNDARLQQISAHIAEFTIHALRGIAKSER